MKNLITAKFETVLYKKIVISSDRKHFLVCIYVSKVLFLAFIKICTKKQSGMSISDLSLLVYY